MAVLTRERSVLGKAFSGDELRRLGGFYLIVALLHVVGWGTLIFLVAPRYPAALGIGVGFTAYLFGLRHAFDADHISAIDNTTRKLMGEGKKPLGVGFFFSLGHSTIVFLLTFLLAAGVKSLAGPVAHGSSPLHRTAGVIGTTVSGTFLYLIA